MNIREATDSDEPYWNKFVLENFPPVGAFLQSWEWGEFQKLLGYNIKRFILEENGRWLGVSLCVERNLPMGFSYFYLPRGPVFIESIWKDEARLAEAASFFLNKLKTDSKSRIFIRLEPAISEIPRIFLKYPFKIPSHYIQPRFNLIVDLTPAENEILARCSSPMRNNIRKATRKGVILNIKSELNEKEWELFKKMQEDTNKRAGKNIFPPEEYFRNLFKAFPSIFYSDIEENKAYSGILAASHNNEFCGMHIVIFFGNTATFLFGASFTNKLSLKISPFLHWNTILEAKRLEYRFYDIGGIDEKLWKTLTYFKEQFGGKKVEYIGNVDFVIIPIFYFIYETLRKIKRLV